MDATLLGSHDSAVSGGGLSPNSKLNAMVHEATVAVGGKSGGGRATITALKSDLLMIQAEIDARTGAAGFLELQQTLHRFADTPNDPVGTQATENALLGLVLLKLNELARTAGAAPSVCSRQSRVGDILSFLGSPPAGHNAAVALNFGGGSMPVSPAHRATADNSATAAPSPITIVAAERPASSKVASRPASRPQSGSRPMDPDSLPQLADDAVDGLPPLRGSAPPQPGSRPATRGALAQRERELEQQVRRLEKQLDLFRYLERTLHNVDAFDATMRHCTMNAVLAEVGVDVKALLGAKGHAPPPHTVTKAGTFKPTLPVATTDKKRPADDDADGALTPVEEQLNATGGAASVHHASTDAPDATALRSLVGFQNAVVSLLADELRRAKPLVQAPPPAAVPASPAAARSTNPATSMSFDPSASTESVNIDMSASTQNRNALSAAVSAAVASAVDAERAAGDRKVAALERRVRSLEAALTQRTEQLQSERDFHMVRHERAANTIVVERARTSTPSGQTRPTTVMSMLAAASRPPTTTTPTPGGPLLATREADLAGAAELGLRRAISQQQKIIRDLQSRGQTPA